MQSGFSGGRLGGGLGRRQTWAGGEAKQRPQRCLARAWVSLGRAPEGADGRGGLCQHSPQLSSASLSQERPAGLLGDTTLRRRLGLSPCPEGGLGPFSRTLTACSWLRMSSWSPAVCLSQAQLCPQAPSVGSPLQAFLDPTQVLLCSAFSARPRHFCHLLLGARPPLLWGLASILWAGGLW